MTHRNMLLRDIALLQIGTQSASDPRVDELEILYRHTPPPPLVAAIFNGRVVSVDEGHKYYALARVSHGPVPVSVRAIENPAETLRLARRANGVEADRPWVPLPSARGVMEVLDVLATDLMHRRLGLPIGVDADASVRAATAEAAAMLGWEECPCSFLGLDALDEPCIYCADVGYLPPGTEEQ